MGLFFDILSSINDPHQQGSLAQLNSVIDNMAQIRDRHYVDDFTMQSLMSALALPIQNALQRRSSSTVLGSFLNQLAQSSSGDFSQLFPMDQRQHLIHVLAQRSGIDERLVRSLLPTLVPLALQLLNMGRNPQDGNASNPIVSQFLQSDRPDLGEVLHFAQRLLNPAMA
ncbi:MAG: hypothetical protein VKJ24_18020 [Synechococcales bacterium]|nr:hypothetical protein [Synechococcales bacterium]